MPLSFGKSSPKDMLAKARRDLTRLEAAEKAQDGDEISDSLFDLAVALTSIRDWLQKHPSLVLPKATVAQYSAASIALESFRDIANAGKHRVITRYLPKTSDVLASAPSSSLAVLGTRSSGGYPRLKIISTDGARHRAVDVAHTAIRDWQAFMDKHGVL